MERSKMRIVGWLRWLETYTKTDMVYLVKNSFWVNANTIVTSIFAFTLSVIFARLIDKEVYGTYQFLISVSGILGALTLTGMNTAVTQAVARGFDGVLSASIKTQTQFAIIPFLAGIGASIYYFIQGNSILSFAIVVIAILLPITNTLNTWYPFLSGKKNFKSIFYYSFIINVIYYSGLITCIIIFPYTFTLICVNFFLLACSNCIVYLLVKRKYPTKGGTEDKAIDYGKKLSLSNILPMIALNIDNIAIFHFFGATHLAIYAFASNIPERLGSLLRPIAMVSFPKFAEKDQREMSKILPRKTLQLFTLALVGGLIYLGIAPLFFKIFFPQYIESVIYSQIYAIAIIIGITGQLPLTSLLATRSKSIYKFNILSPLFSIIAISSLVYFFGIWGAITGKIFSNSFSLFYSYILKNE